MAAVKEVATQDDDGGNLRTVHLVLLSSCITAVEGATAYALTYAFLTLQYLGVPTSLASFNGVIGGSASTFLIPFFGTLSDRGSNPKKRKTVALALNALIFVTGFVCLFAAGILKIKESGDNRRNGNGGILSQNASTANHITYSDNQTTPISLWRDSPDDMIDTSGGHTASLLPAILGLTGFSLLDFGFDLGNAVSRAFAVEFTPNAQHNTVFNVISFLAPFTAFIMSVFGIFNFPKILDASFQIDGTAATVMIFSSMLIILAISSTAVSIATSRWLERRKKFEHKSPRVGVSDTSLLISHKGGPGPLSKEKQAFRQSFDSTLDGFSTASFTLSYQRECEDKNMTESILENPSETQPLLVGYRNSARLHSGTYDGSVSYYDVKEGGLPEENGQREGRSEENSQPPDRGIRVDVSKEPFTQGSAKNPRFFTRKLVTLIMSIFAGFLCLCSFSNYASLSVATGIFHGDPLASLGSEGRQLYNTGLQRAAVGNTLMFVSCFTTCFFSKYLLKLMGPRLMYFTFQLLHSTATVAHIVFQREEIYYLAMVVFGLFRYAIFTIPFMMANDFTNESMGYGDDVQKPEDKDKDTKISMSKTGRVISIIGILCPINYLITSALAGPLIDQTGNVWLPMIYSASGGFLSAILFLPLFFLK